MMTQSKLIELLQSDKCVCRHLKRAYALLCTTCWDKLPKVMQKALTVVYGQWMKLPDAAKYAVPSGLTTEEYFFVYECAVDWVTWTPVKAAASARVYLRGEV
jgi:hypothetical protein